MMHFGPRRIRALRCELIKMCLFITKIKQTHSMNRSTPSDSSAPFHPETPPWSLNEKMSAHSKITQLSRVKSFLNFCDASLHHMADSVRHQSFYPSNPGRENSASLFCAFTGFQNVPGLKSQTLRVDFCDVLCCMSLSFHHQSSPFNEAHFRGIFEMQAFLNFGFGLSQH